MASTQPPVNAASIAQLAQALALTELGTDTGANSSQGASLIGWDNGTITTYFQNHVERQLASFSELASVDVTKYLQCFTQGYYAPGDRGHASWVYNAATPAESANGVTIVASTFPDAAGCWIMLTDGRITARACGLKGDGVTNDTAQCQAAINAIAQATNIPTVLLFDQAPSPGWIIFGVVLQSNICLRASSYKPGARCVGDVVFTVPSGAEPGWMISTSATLTTSYCGVEGIYLLGRAVSRTSAAAADNGYTAGFGGLSYGPGYQRSIKSNTIVGWGESGIQTLGSNQTSIKDNLLYNCVLYRVRTGYIGAANLQETDSYIYDNEWGTSTQIEGTITNSEPYLCAAYYYLGGNNFCSANVHETSEIGCVDDSFYSRHVMDRFELNYAHGAISLDGGQAYINPFFRDNSRAAANTYCDLIIETNYKPARLVSMPNFEYDSGSNLPLANIQDNVSVGNMTCYIGRQPPITSFAWSGQLWNEQLPPFTAVTNGQNAIRNSSMAGAVAGTPGIMPNNWAIAQSAGLTFSVLDTGFENNVGFIDIEITGTPTGTYFEIDFDTSTAIPAAANQTWTVSAFTKLSAGTLAGSITVGIDEYGGGSFLGGGSSAYYSATQAYLGTQRITYTRVLQSATTGYIKPLLQGLVSEGVAVNMTLRIGFPQLEQFSTAGSPIPTATNAVTFPTQPEVAYLFQGQNVLRNASGSGAVVGTPGTAPTYWSAGGAGLTTNVVNSGVENGIPFVDFAISGTATGTFWEVLFDATNEVPASVGQTWTASVFSKLVAGSLANLTEIVVTIIEYAAGAFETQGATQFTPLPNSNLVNGRYVLTRTLATSTVSTTMSGIQLLFNEGAQISLTLRVGLPQLEQGSAAGSPVPTYGTSVSAPLIPAVVYPFQGENYLRNASMIGAVAGAPGTLPTYWSAGGAGLTTSVLDTGVENGIPYIDFVISGTSTGTSWQTLFESATEVTVAAAQVWTASVYAKLAAGSDANVTATEVIINEYASGTYSGGASAQFTPGGPTNNLATSRYSATMTIGASVTTATCGVLMTFAVGAVINMTLRIGLPQFENRSTVGAPVSTKGTAVSLF
jgi:hypothetical protein